MVTPGGPFPPGGALDRAAAAGPDEKNCGGRIPARSERSHGSFALMSIIERYYNFGGEGIRAASRLRRARGAGSECAGDRSPGSAKRLLDRALLVEPMRRWRERICAQIRSDRHAQARRSCRPTRRPIEDRSSSNGAPTPNAFARAPAALCRSIGPADTVAVFAGAFRTWHGAIHIVDGASRAARARPARHRRGVHRRRPRAARVREAARGARRGDLHRRAAARSDARVPRGVRHRRRAVRPGRHPALSLGFYWSPLKIFEYMAAGLPVVAPAIDRIPRSSATIAKDCCTIRRIPTGLPHALEALADRGAA